MSREIRITPSILNADFSRLDEEIKRISAVSDLLHLDVMDDFFVPNFTFDFEAASAIIKSSVLAVDAHLMVADVDGIAVQYAEIGCASVTIHAEATKNIPQTLRNIRKAGGMIGDRPIWLQVDGGISLKTIEMALDAGADTFVVGSAVFNAPDPAEMVVLLRDFATAHGNK